MPTIREDIVSIGFEVESNPFKEITDGIDDMKKAVTGGVGDSIDDLKKMAKEAGNAADGVDEIKKSAKGLNVAKEKAAELFKGLKNVAGVTFDKVTGGIKNIATQAGKATAAVGKGLAKGIGIGIGAAATAVGGLVTKSTQAYADFEQLTGGVETLFKHAAPNVMKYANDAYKTAGMTANEYMDTVTSFSASLLQSVGGDTGKAASLADKAIRDMADNANKMGSDLESLSTAYQGFAKGQYQLLDNLKLGYGGTKDEMARLIKDAAKLDKSVDANSMSYGNIVKAIHAVQNEMGITGTTAKEAEQTISGSLAGMKSAWGNLLTSLVQGGASFDQCVGNLVESAKTFAKNVIPVAKSALSGLVTLIDELAPVIIAELPALISDLLPPVMNAGMQLVQVLLDTIGNNTEMISGMAVQLITSFAEFIFANLPQIINTGIQLIVSLVQGLTQQLPALIPVAIQAIVQIISGLGAGLPQLVAFLPEIANAIIDGLSQIDLLQIGKDLMQGFIDGIGSMIGSVGKAATNIAKAAGNAIKDFLGISSPAKLTIEQGQYAGEGLALGMENMTGDVKKAAVGLNAPIAQYTPSGSGVSTTNNNRSVVNHYSPQFTLNMNGASATESNKRKVKKWVKESMQEVFESMGRTNPELCEV